MKKLVTVIIGVLVLGFTAAAHADFVGNKSSKLFFPDTCSYVKMIKKDNIVNFKTTADAVKAGFKASSKCNSDDAVTIEFVGNKSSKLFFPANCSFVKMIKDDNKVTFKTLSEAVAAGYKASSKCAQ